MLQGRWQPQTHLPVSLHSRVSGWFPLSARCCPALPFSVVFEKEPQSGLAFAPEFAPTWFTRRQRRRLSVRWLLPHLPVPQRAPLQGAVSGSSCLCRGVEAAEARTGQPRAPSAEAV